MQPREKEKMENESMYPILPEWAKNIPPLSTWREIQADPYGRLILSHHCSSSRNPLCIQWIDVDRKTIMGFMGCQVKVV
jgi:hypothetical protein